MVSESRKMIHKPRGWDVTTLMVNTPIATSKASNARVKVNGSVGFIVLVWLVV